MGDVKPASELRDRVPCPLPRAPGRRFTPTTGARWLGPDFWGGETEDCPDLALYTTALVAMDETTERQTDIHHY